MVNLLKIFWIVLFLLSASSHAEGINRLDLSIKEVMGIYNDIENKPTLNSCRVHKKENRYYLPEDCNFFVFTAYILENECATGGKSKIAIGSHAMSVNFKVNKSTCNYLDGKPKVLNKKTKGVLKPVKKMDDRAVSAVNISSGFLKPVDTSKSSVSSVSSVVNSVTGRVVASTDKTEKINPTDTANKIKQKKYFLQVYVGNQYPNVDYECDDLIFYTNVIGEYVYILSDKYLYADAIKIQAQVLSCGFKTWLRPADMDWF